MLLPLSVMVIAGSAVAGRLGPLFGAAAVGAAGLVAIVAGIGMPALVRQNGIERVVA
ncbi:hypothetical protein ACTD5D_21180 [Nocardia takedensis]|uniref:hypothetical protein n=1 Tax=Nocardia takedensis TaxID=259390 RepID=UPI003F75C85F